jgi:hypothetical protein
MFRKADSIGRELVEGRARLSTVAVRGQAIGPQRVDQYEEQVEVVSRVEFFDVGWLTEGSRVEADVELQIDRRDDQQRPGDKIEPTRVK